MNIQLIAGLNTGGAEKALYRLLCSINFDDVLVISLTSLGAIGKQLEAQGF